MNRLRNVVAIPQTALWLSASFAASSTQYIGRPSRRSAQRCYPFVTGSMAYQTEFFGGYFLDFGTQIILFWNNKKTTYDGHKNEYYGCYGLQAVSSNGSFINTFDGLYATKYGVDFPQRPYNNRVWLIGSIDASTTSGTNTVWYSVLNSDGEEIIPQTQIETLQNANGSAFRGTDTMALGNNTLLLWERYWRTSTDKTRTEIAYQVRDTSGNLVKSTTTLTPLLLSDSDNRSEYYNSQPMISDKQGKVWISYFHHITGLPDVYYYVILGTDGNIWKGPVSTPAIRIFQYCDKEGYIWANENGQFLALNPDDTIAVSPRTGAWNPNQTVGLIAASVGTSGYRLYDRWSPQTIGIDVPAGVSADLMQLFDLNLWGNNLHPADVNITKGATSIWSQTGQFTGHAAVNVSSLLDEGQNMLTIAQDDFLGGQVLVAFPYNPLAADITGDGKVNFEDIEVMADQWLQLPGVPSGDIAPPPDGDGAVNFLDFAVLAAQWLEGTE